MRSYIDVLCMYVHVQYHRGSSLTNDNDCPPFSLFIIHVQPTPKLKLIVNDTSVGQIGEYCLEGQFHRHWYDISIHAPYIGSKTKMCPNTTHAFSQPRASQACYKATKSKSPEVCLPKSILCRRWMISAARGSHLEHTTKHTIS